MGDFKPGDEVLVKARVAYVQPGRLGLEVDGNDRLLDVETVLVRPAEPAGDWVDQAFGGMPGGTVEVDQQRWLELPEDRRAAIRVIVKDFGGKAGGETVRFFEVVSRG